MYVSVHVPPNSVLGFIFTVYIIPEVFLPTVISSNNTRIDGFQLMSLFIYVAALLFLLGIDVSEWDCVFIPLKLNLPVGLVLASRTSAKRDMCDFEKEVFKRRHAIL